MLQANIATIVPVTWLDKLQGRGKRELIVTTQSSDKKLQNNETLQKWAQILGIPHERWNEQLVQQGTLFLEIAEQLQADLSVKEACLPVVESAGFSAAELLMRCVCAALKDSLTGNKTFHNFVKEKSAVALSFYSLTVSED